MLVYSTNPDLMREEEETVETLSPDRQQLRVSIERHHRGGKTVTLVRGFVGTDDDLNDLARSLKNKCGVGGSAKEGEIVIQGELKEKVTTLLRTMGYSRTK
ncbi:MAG: translation initiation factor [Bacteroidales bacterium]|nr:translation initiation factor [Bacteroidales bacterium]